jgi:hypothetical protein
MKRHVVTLVLLVVLVVLVLAGGEATDLGKECES